MLKKTSEIVATTGAVGSAMLIIVFVIAWIAARHVTKPIRALALSAQKIADGDLEAKADVRTHDELGELGKRFNDMVPKLRERLHLRDSLTLAQQVQQALLPNQPPRVSGLDIAGTSIYCDETGGDYFDYITQTTFGKQAIAIVIGDVTGHGIAAALLMTTGRALLRSRLDQSGSLDQIITDVNRHLFDEDLEGRFMTMLCLVVDPEQRHACWVGAGHDAALVYDPATDQFSEWSGEDPPLAVIADYRFTECRTDHWPDGAIITVGTDGIWEQRNPAGEMFGKARLCEVIRAHADRPAAEIVTAITDTLTRFRSSVDQTDDVTVVVIRTDDAKD